MLSKNFEKSLQKPLARSSNMYILTALRKTEGGEEAGDQQPETVGKGPKEKVKKLVDGVGKTAKVTVTFDCSLIASRA